MKKTTLSSLFQPKFHLEDEVYALLFERWEDVAKAVGVTLKSESVFDKISSYLEKEGIFEALAKEFPEAQPVKFLTGNKNLYYVYLSAFQKAIRYGLPDLALKYYRTLSHNGMRNQVNSRLRTIVVEDIGIADPFLCSYVLHEVGNNKIPPHMLMEYLIVVCCNTAKSRLQTDIFQAVYYPDAYLKEMREILLVSHKDAREAILGGEYTIMEFQLYLMRLRGSKQAEQFPSLQMPAANAAELSKLYDALEIPRVLRRLLDQTGGMYVPFAGALIVAWSLSDGLTYKDNPFPKPPMPLITGLLSAGFDQHTQVGKRAFAYARKSHEAYYETIPDKKVDHFGHAVFRTEGAWLDQHVSNAAFDSLYWDSLEDCWRFEGWESNDQARLAYEYVAVTMEPLNTARTRIWT